jgi:hypothetical protein
MSFDPLVLFLFDRGRQSLAARLFIAGGLQGFAAIATL